MMDLSKSLDCIPHGLMIARLPAYGKVNTTLKEQSYCSLKLIYARL